MPGLIAQINHADPAQGGARMPDFDYDLGVIGGGAAGLTAAAGGARLVRGQGRS